MLEGGGNMTVTEGSEETLIVRGDEGLIGSVDTEVLEGELRRYYVLGKALFP